MVVAEDLGREMNYSDMCCYLSVLSELSKCAKNTGLGFRLSLGTKERKIVFDIIKEIERNAAQN